MKYRKFTVAKISKALGGLLNLLGKTPAREDIGAFKDIPANDPVDLSKVKELHRDLDFQTTESIRLGMVPRGTEFDASIFNEIPDIAEYYEDLPNIFKFDNPNSLRSARDERINFIDSQEKIDKIRSYGFPIERDPDFKGDPGPDNVNYRAFLRKKNMKFSDVFDYDPNKITGNELLQKQAEFEFYKEQGFDPDTIRELLNIELDKDR